MHTWPRIDVLVEDSWVTGLGGGHQDVLSGCPTVASLFQSCVMGSAERNHERILERCEERNVWYWRQLHEGTNHELYLEIKKQPAPSLILASPFSDVPMHVYYKAILWGCQNGVTKGYASGLKKGYFGVNDTYTRGQIVKFLYNIRRS